MAEKRGPGRPPLDVDDPSVDVHLKLPSKQYESLCERAERDRVSVCELIRRDLSLAQLQNKETENR